MTVDVLSNDSYGDTGRIQSVVQPSAGTVTIDGSQLKVEIPQSYAGEIRFSYTISDESGSESTASVVVLSANVLNPVSELVDTRTTPTGSISSALEDGGELLSSLLEVRLLRLHIASVVLAPIVLGLMWLAIGRREFLVSVTKVNRSETVELEGSHGSLSVRHDELLWTTKKTAARLPGSKVPIEVSNGSRAVIDGRLIEDTGY